MDGYSQNIYEPIRLRTNEKKVCDRTTLEAIAAGHPAARIDELMPWHFDKQA